MIANYTNILLHFRKDDTGNLSETPTQTKVLNNRSNNVLPEQPKRPFKITDINNVKTPISKLQLSKITRGENSNDIINATPNRSNTPGIRRLKEQEFPIKELPNENVLKSIERKEILHDFNQIHTFNNSHNEYITNDFKELSKFKLQDPANENLEQRAEIDFSIDQPMFNPKKLLQCFNKYESDIVIPPPPEFCDENELTSQGTFSVPLDCYEPMRWEHFHGNNSNESIFEEDSNIELTPRKEIETWTLSQNDENTQNLATSTCFNPKQSFTIVPTPRRRGSSFQSVSLSTQNKLRQFKICPKKNLKKV